MFEARGWTVLRIWECELRKKNEAALIHRLLNLIEVVRKRYTHREVK